jgi:hypothetical protein
MRTFDARSTPRHSVAAKAVCRTTEAKITAVVSNLSSDGCCLTFDWHMLTPEQRVTVRIGELDGLPARVRWVDGLRAGIAFDRSIYEPVLDHLVRQHGLVAAMTVETW